MELRKYLGEVFRKLATQEESRIEEGYLTPDQFTLSGLIEIRRWSSPMPAQEPIQASKTSGPRCATASLMASARTAGWPAVAEPLAPSNPAMRHRGDHIRAARPGAARNCRIVSGRRRLRRRKHIPAGKGLDRSRSSRPGRKDDARG